MSEEFFDSISDGDEVKLSGRNLPRPLISGRSYFVIKSEVEGEFKIRLSFSNRDFKLGRVLDIISIPSVSSNDSDEVSLRIVSQRDSSEYVED